MARDGDRLDAILREIILLPAPGDLSGRHPECPPTGCWGHSLKVRADGYREVRLHGKRHRLHRLIYETLRTPIPAEMVPDHLCRNRECCNPDHLEPVQQRLNILRGDAPAAKNVVKTHCLHGHPLSGANLRISSSGKRQCRACQREYQGLRPKRNRAGYNRRWWAENGERLNEKRRHERQAVR